MRTSYLAVAVAVAFVSTSALASGDNDRGGRRSSGHSNSGGSAGARHGSSASSSRSSSSRSGYTSQYRSAAPRYSSNRGATSGYRAGGGRSDRGFRSDGRGSSYRNRSSYGSRSYYGGRSYYGSRSYYRPGFSLYVGSPWYYDSYYGGNYYPETYGYAPYATDYAYRAPADYAYRAPAEDAYPAPAEDARAQYDDRDVDGFADSADSGRLRLDVRPADATIYVDDQFRGTAGSGTVLTLASGRHRVEVTRPGFQSERRVVEVGSGEARSLSIALQPARR